MKAWALQARRSGHSITQAHLWWEFKHQLQVQANSLAVQASQEVEDLKVKALQMRRTKCLKRILQAESNLENMKTAEEARRPLQIEAAQATEAVQLECQGGGGQVPCHLAAAGQGLVDGGLWRRQGPR